MYKSTVQSICVTDNYSLYKKTSSSKCRYLRSQQRNDNGRQRKNLPHVWVKFLFHRPTGIGYSLKIVRN